VIRFAALKLDYEQLKSSYGNLSKIYKQFENGNALGVSKLLMRIRSGDGILGLPEDDRTLRRFMDGPQPAEYDAGPADNHDQSLAGYCAVTGREVTSHSKSCSGSFGARQHSVDTRPQSRPGGTMSLEAYLIESLHDAASALTSISAASRLSPAYHFRCSMLVCLI
jgi:hypothetical protein